MDNKILDITQKVATDFYSKDLEAFKFSNLQEAVREFHNDYQKHFVAAVLLPITEAVTGEEIIAQIRELDPDISDEDLDLVQRELISVISVSAMQLSIANTISSYSYNTYGVLAADLLARNAMTEEKRQEIDSSVREILSEAIDRGLSNGISIGNDLLETIVKTLSDNTH